MSCWTSAKKGAGAKPRRIDDFGAATAFLALDGAKLITGGVTYVDGGYHITD
jgi:enoyl-[acyl-carrier-protein] reductase (NADH)